MRKESSGKAESTLPKKKVTCTIHGETHDLGVELREAPPSGKDHDAYWNGYNQAWSEKQLAARCDGVEESENQRDYQYAIWLKRQDGKQFGRAKNVWDAAWNDATRFAELRESRQHPEPSPPTAEVFSRPECPFNYCDTKDPHTECLKGCRHA